MPTTITNYSGPKPDPIVNYSGCNQAGFPAPVVIEGFVDFHRTVGLAQNDIAQVVTIPAGTYIQAVHWSVETVEGAARNFSIGDGDNTTGWIGSTSANSVASGASTFAGTLGGTGAAADPVVVTGYSAGKYYAAADTLDVIAQTSGGLTTAKIRIKAVGWIMGV